MQNALDLTLTHTVKKSKLVILMQEHQVVKAYAYCWYSVNFLHYYSAESEYK